MHIPDGFIAPQMYLPLYIVAGGCWFYAVRQVKKNLHEDSIPLLALLTAFAFVLGTIALPLPGGTSTHVTGIAMLALLFGVWISFLAFSVVLLLQALLFGEGGITSLPLNALAMGWVGSAVAIGVFKLLGRYEKIALFLSGWLALNSAALIMAIALGLQPWLAQDDSGTPLFFPFSWHITLPAVMLPHLFIGIGEALLTLVVYRFSQTRRNRLHV
jgi:cobalt/nickel transport system permease protein